MSVKIIPWDRKVQGRMESGPVQFGNDDWPGVFLRGDSAMWLGQLLSHVTEPHLKLQLSGFIGMLNGCDARLTDSVVPANTAKSFQTT